MQQEAALVSALVPDDESLVADDESQQVPTVDFALISQANDDETRKLVAAAKEWGFLQIINHGVSPKLLAEMEEQLCLAFALPFEAKMRAEPCTAAYSYGYFSKSSVKDGKSLRWNEAFRLPLKAHQREDIIIKLWPEGNERFSSVSTEYIATVQSILLQLLERLAAGLGLDPLKFTQFLSEDGNSSALRMNFYDPLPQPMSPTLAFPAHSDPHVLTILQQNGVDGLQILRDDKWIAVRPQPGALLVNVGDILQVMSNDVYQSVVHRVVMKSDKLRVSNAFALALDPKTPVRTVPELLAGQQPSKYRPFTSDELLGTIQLYGFSGKDHLHKFRHIPAVT